MSNGVEETGVGLGQASDADPGSAAGTLVLITGTGRSGTSTVSGTLHHLGLHVPGPYLGANRSNPKGFYESRWAVDFHKEITRRRARINDFDGRPDAFRLASEAVTPELRERLVTWLREQSAGGPQLVVKDPRSVWTQRLWEECAKEVGLTIAFVSMLRHPAEVVGSRATYYASSADEVQRRRYQVCNVGRWINSSLVSERETRGARRSFVPYTDLLGDWRTTMARVRDELGLTYNSDLQASTQHPVDGFIDPNLRRVRVTWDDLQMTGDLRDIAQQTWDALTTIAASGGAHEQSSRDLDDLAERYERLFTDSAAISHDAIEGAVDKAERKAVREVRAKLRRQAKRSRTRAAARAAAPSALEDRALRDVTARELVTVLGRRGKRRLRPKR